MIKKTTRNKGFTGTIAAVGGLLNLGAKAITKGTTFVGGAISSGNDELVEYIENNPNSAIADLNSKSHKRIGQESYAGGYKFTNKWLHETDSPVAETIPEDAK